MKNRYWARKGWGEEPQSLLDNLKQAAREPFTPDGAALAQDNAQITMNNFLSRLKRIQVVSQDVWNLTGGDNRETEAAWQEWVDTLIAELEKLTKELGGL